MPESIYEFVLERLEQSKGTWDEVALKTGVPLRSIEKIARREWKNPGISHIETLWTHFRADRKRPGRRALHA